MSDIQFLEIAGFTIFGLAVLHTFFTNSFLRAAKRSTHHAGLWHLLGEVEVVFGFWALILVVCISLSTSRQEAIAYLEEQNFTEPLFVFVILTVAATRPILQPVQTLVQQLAERLPFNPALGTYFLSLSLIPLFGSFITEPAAMTLAALLLRDSVYRRGISERLKYATLGILFVNISIGGVLTSFAAPPVLMVAETWGWNIHFMYGTFGWKAIYAVLINSLLVTLYFRKDIAAIQSDLSPPQEHVPLSITLVHVIFLVATVVLSHHPVVFLALFMFFLGFTEAYQRYQDKLMLREGLLVAFFLAGLVVLGGKQQWWLQPILQDMKSLTLFLGAMGLTAITDNAALTYLGSLVDGMSDSAKYALVAGAVSGGGLTVIANAPNPAGFAILKDYFDQQSISPLGLFLAALLPTAVAACCFWLM